MVKLNWLIVLFLVLKGGLAAQDPYTLRILYPGDPSPRMQTFLTGEFQSAMLRDLNMKVEVTFVPWPDYRDKLDLLIATNNPPDWFWRGTFETGMYASRKQVQPLDELLKAYGPDLLRVIPAANFQPNKIAGKVYSIPSQRSSTAEKFYTILARTDLLDAVGVRSITTFAQLVDAATRIKARFPEIVPFASVPWLALLREAAPGWYSNDFGITLVNENEPNPRVYGFFEQKDVVLKLNALANQLVRQGLVSQEVLTDPNNDVGRFQSGRCAFWTGAISRPLEQLEAVRKNAPAAQLREFTLNPGAQRYIFQASNEALFVPAGNKHPEKAIQFLNWIYKSPENYEFLLFGVKGKDFTTDARGRMTRITKDDLFYEWMFRNNTYLRMPTSVSEEFIGDYGGWDQGARYSKLFGFTFDQAKVVDVASAIYALAPRYNPVLWGLVDARQGTLFEDIQSTLRKAGIGKYLEEYNRQLASYRATVRP